MGKGLEAAISHIKKNYGEGSVMKGEMSFDVQVIPTGCLSVDIATGVGGLPRGRIVELLGPAGTGKSSLAMHTVAQAQKMGLNVAYIDVEHAVDPTYATKIGVNMDEMFISQPDSGEEALEISEIFLRSGEVSLIVVDSVDALVPRSVIDGEMGDKHVADLARLMSQAVRKLNGIVSKANACFIFINQLRSGISTMSYGPAEVSSGGVALKYYASMRMEVRSIGKLKGMQEEIIGNRTRVKIVKNKVASPFKEAEMDLIFGRGFSPENDVLDLAIANDVVDKSGSWYSFNSSRLGQGRISTLAFLNENTEMLETIRASVLKVKRLTNGN